MGCKNGSVVDAVVRGEVNVKNRTSFVGNDNLYKLRGFNDACMDLVFIDPPFSKNPRYGFLGGSKGNEVFKSMINLVPKDEEWLIAIKDSHPNVYRACEAGLNDGKSMKSYLVCMARRIMEIHRILKPTGSFCLYCDTAADSYLRVLCDAIFGYRNRRNTIILCKPPAGGTPKYGFPDKHDVVLIYGKSDVGTWHQPYTDMTESSKKSYSAVDEDGRRYSKAHGGKTYLDESKGRPLPSWWTDIPSVFHLPKRERLGYHGQKARMLPERLIEAFTDEGDWVMDCFSGGGTTPDAAERLGRNWVAIDVEEQSHDILVTRFNRGVEDGVFDPEVLRDVKYLVRDDIPSRTDQGEPPSKKEAKQKLFGDQKGICNGCEKRFGYPFLEIDHIVPRKKGGGENIENLQLMCRPCNGIKSWTMSQEQLKAELRKRGILK